MRNCVRVKLPLSSVLERGESRMPPVTLATAESFVDYWSRNHGGDNINLIFRRLALSSEHIESFRGHESRVAKLTFRGSFICHKKVNGILFWRLLCNCSSLISLDMGWSSKFFMDHFHWCCYRPSICQSLKSLINWLSESE